LLVPGDRYYGRVDEVMAQIEAARDATSATASTCARGRSIFSRS